MPSLQFADRQQLSRNQDVKLGDTGKVKRLFKEAEDRPLAILRLSRANATDTHAPQVRRAIAMTLSRFVIPLLLTGIFLQAGSTTVDAQSTHDAGLWTSLNTQGPLDLIEINDQRMKWWFDAHARFADDSDGYLQSILRPGVGYDIGGNATLWVGYAWIHDSPVNNAPSFHENRIWQQLTWSTEWLGGAKLSSRSRLEQRFITTGDDVGWRFRQFMKLKVPLANRPGLAAVVWDEIFMDLNSTDTGQIGSFSQNRVFAGLGFELDGYTNASIEVGYFNQYLRRRQSDDRMSHNVGINYFRKF